MENVPRARGSTAYASARRILEYRGYSVAETVLDASFFGVPQKRRRFFSVAWLGADAGKTEKLRRYYDSRRSASRLSVAEYLGDELDIEHYYRHPRNYSRRGVFSVLEPSPVVRGVNRPVPPGYEPHRLDTAPASEVRPLTFRERGRVQTFPESWDWETSAMRIAKTDIELLIGNAVPPKLAELVACGVRESLL